LLLLLLLVVIVVIVVVEATFVSPHVTQMHLAGGTDTAPSVEWAKLPMCRPDTALPGHALFALFGGLAEQFM
jgi:hypothetical protein